MILLAVALPLAVLADTVHNDVVIDGTDTITSGGSTTIYYWITAEPVNKDGQGGCNAADGSAATLAVGAPANVTASSSTLTFTNCGGSDKQPVTFSSSTPGDYLISLVVSDSRNGQLRHYRRYLHTARITVYH